jgi:hypothetical protein
MKEIIRLKTLQIFVVMKARPTVGITQYFYNHLIEEESESLQTRRK